MQPTMYPKWIVFQLVEACNLRCPMCYEWGERGSYLGQRPARLPFEIARQVIQDCSPGKPFFELFGGEPFLHSRISDLIKLIGETGCALGIPTNGTLLTRFTDILVGDAPIRLWISLDGPEKINDLQRGSGVFRRALEGIEGLHSARIARGCAFPQIGMTYVVTPLNCEHVERFFLESIELSKLDFVEIVLQNFATEDECDDYETIVKRDFGGISATHARGYIRDVDHFSGMDLHRLSAQIHRVRSECRKRKVLFLSIPMTFEPDNLEHYVNARWHAMSDRRSRCAFPWMYAEVSARGDVTTCHSFYDITVGNVRDSRILDIWHGARMGKLRDHLRTNLLPICTACCRYYNNPMSSVFNGIETTKVAVSFPVRTGERKAGAAGSGET